MNDRDRELQEVYTHYASQPHPTTTHTRRRGAFRTPLLFRMLNWYFPVPISSRQEELDAASS